MLRFDLRTWNANFNRPLWILTNNKQIESEKEVEKMQLEHSEHIKNLAKKHSEDKSVLARQNATALSQHREQACTLI